MNDGSGLVGGRVADCPWRRIDWTECPGDLFPNSSVGPSFSFVEDCLESRTGCTEVWGIAARLNKLVKLLLRSIPMAV